MKALKFTLSGKTAFFKRPDANTGVFYTFGSIHKVALLGMFGAILGLKGYNQQQKSDQYPEFYAKLKNLKIAIKINNEKAYIPKKVQTFNNDTGFFNRNSTTKMGVNLIVKEQWMHNPSWDIFVLLDSLEAEVLKEAFMAKQAVFIPCLGKNDHPANILEARIIDAGVLEDEISFVHSLFPSMAEELLEDTGYGHDDYCWSFQDTLPIGLHPHTNLYERWKFIQTNSLLAYGPQENTYECEGEVIHFF